MMNGKIHVMYDVKKASEYDISTSTMQVFVHLHFGWQAGDMSVYARMCSNVCVRVHVFEREMDTRIFYLTTGPCFPTTGA
jgi:hypothetical protein